MILNETAIIQGYTVIKGTEGQSVKTYTAIKTISVSVQPAGLNKSQLETFGISDLISNAKKVFYYHDETIRVGMRLICKGIVYDILGTNPDWPIHSEAIIAPVQGV